MEGVVHGGAENHQYRTNAVATLPSEEVSLVPESHLNLALPLEEALEASVVPEANQSRLATSTATMTRANYPRSPVLSNRFLKLQL